MNIGRQILFFLFFFLGFSIPCLAAPAAFVYQGQIIKPDQLVLEASSVDFIVELYSPGGEECLLYQETHTINMTGSNGLFSLTIGSGSRSGTDFEDTTTLDQAIDNYSGSISPTTCAVGTTYNPNAGDARKLRVSFDDGTSSVTMSDQLIQSVPYAQQASTVGGIPPGNLLQINTGGTYVLTQANLENVFDGANHTELLALLGGTSSNYMLSTPTSSPDFNNQVVDGVAAPVDGDDATNKNYVDQSLGGTTLDNTDLGTLGVGQAGEVLTWDGTKWHSTTIPSSGDFLADGSVAMTGNIRLNDNYLSNDGGNEGIRVDDSGNVGIGTTAPTAPLEVASELGATHNAVFTNHGGATFVSLRSSNGTQASPTALNTNDVLGALGFSGYGATGFEVNNLAVIKGVAAENFTDSARGTHLTFSTAPIGAEAITEKMRITSSGNVGIGTTAPASPLTVSATDSTTTASNKSLLLTNQAGAERLSLGLSTNSGADYVAQIQAHNGFDVSLGSTGVEFMRLQQSSGNVGIGTNTPSSKLEVSSLNGAVATSSLDIQKTDFAYMPAAWSDVAVGHQITGLLSGNSAVDIGFGAGQMYGLAIDIKEEGTDDIATMRGISNIVSVGDNGSIKANQIIGQLTAASGKGSADVQTVTGLEINAANYSTVKSSAVFGSKTFVSTGPGGIGSATGIGVYNSGDFSTVDSFKMIHIGNSITKADFHPIYSDNPNPSYFKAGIGIGTTTPSGLLDIEGGDVFLGDATLTNGSGDEDLSVKGNIEVDGAYYGDGSNLTGVIASSSQASGNTSNYIINADSDGAGGGDIDFQINGSTMASVENNGDFIVDGNTLLVDASTDSVVLGGTSTTVGKLNIATSASVAPDIVLDGVGGFGAEQSLYLYIDGDNSSTTDSFVIKKDTFVSGAGTELFRVQEDGNVGIGTAVPDSILHTYGSGDYATFENRSTATNTANRALTIKRSTSADMVDGFGVTMRFGIEDSANVHNDIARIRAVREGADNEGALIFRTGTDGDDFAMKIDPAGNVGIGTTNPTTKLDVRSTLSVKSSDGLKTHMRVEGVSEYGLLRMMDNINAEKVRLSTSPSFSTYFNGGNVGIGTTNPVDKLHVSDGEIFHDSFVTSYLTSRSANGSAATPTAVSNGDVLGQVGWIGYGATGYHTNTAARIVAGAEENFTDATGAGYLALHTRATGGVAGSSERMRIDSEGNVGIGTAAPDANSKLAVIGNDENLDLRIENQDSTVGRSVRLLVSNYRGGSTGAATVDISNYRGTKSTTLANQSGDSLGSLNFYGYGTSWIRGASVSAETEEIYTGSSGATALQFQTTSAGQTAATEKMRITSSGNVGIGTATPVSKLEVNGAARNAASILNATSTVDFSTGNIQYTNANCGAFNLHNLKDGGMYTFVVKGTTSGTCSFSAYSDAGTTAITVHLPSGHGATTATEHTIYSVMVVGSDAYFAWVTAFD